MADPFASLDLDALVKQATAAPPSTAYVGDTIKRVRDLEAQKQAETAPIVDRMKSDFAADRKDVEAKTPQPADVTAWTQKMPEAHPVEAFGSFGSVFGILASAFVHAPWQTAMTAASSAMNAVRANDIAGYKDAYQAWKSNTDLMLKRHDEQYKDFQAAMAKMKTDTAEGNAMLTAMSAKYGDQITEAYKEAGLQGELNTIWDSRQNLRLRLAETMPRIEDLNTQVTLVHDLKTAHDEERQARLTGDPAQIEEARRKTQDAEQAVHDYGAVKYGTRSAAQAPERIALDRYMSEHPDASAQDIQDFLVRYKSSGQAQKPDMIALRRYMEEHPDASAEEIQDFMARPKAALQSQRDDAAMSRIEANNSFRGALKDKDTQAAWDRLQASLASKSEDRDKQVAAAAARLEATNGFRAALKDKDLAAAWDRAQASIKARSGEPARVAVSKYLEEHPDASAEDLSRFVSGLRSSGMTGNQRQKLEDRVDQFDNSADKIDQSIGVLDKYIGAAGLSGKALRGKEIVSNIFGSSETDRVQFRRNIEYLQTLSHRLLTDASGRPLSADAKKLDDVIGGLSIGDTTANTLRSLNEVKRLYAKMRADTVSQLQGTWAPRDGGASPAANPSDKPWLDAPVVK